MKKIKPLALPFLFILLSSLLVGLGLFYFISAPETTGKGEETAPAPGPEPLNRDSIETLAYKNETVYVVLDPEGRVVNQRIVNRIYQAKDREAAKIKDYGEYETISNMTSEATPDLRDNVILWDSDLLQDGDIYYEGIIDKSLPVDFQIDYYLDGNKMEAAALEGKSGRLRIVIKMKNNLAVNGTVPYRNYYGESAQKEDLNYVPLLVQGTFTADLNKFSDIKATDGAGIITGQTVNLSFMAFPYPEAEIVLSMEGKEIELSQIMMMIMPQLPPIPDIDMEDDLIEMLDGVTAIEEGLNALYEGADQIYQGLDLFRNKTNELLANIEPLLALVEEWPRPDGLEDEDIRSQLDRVRELLEWISAGRPGEQPDEWPEPGEWPEGWPEEWPERPEGWPGEWPEEWPGEWPEGDPEELISYLDEIINLVEQYDDLEKYIDEVEETFAQVVMLPEAINQLADGQKQIRNGLKEINSRGIAEMKKGLIDGVNESKFGKAKIELMRSLADSYRSHADNENNLVSSVQFIVQTDTPKQHNNEKNDPVKKEEEENPPWYTGLWSRFLDLFSRRA
ncbi:MAG: hypothetical protein GX883_01040 [Firmicutes bacterium]|nr:hypothetical protein [Bacillota bacterium]